MANEERIWELVALKLSGEATPEELKELFSLINAHPEENLRLELLKQFWEQKNSAAPDVESSFNKHLQRLSNHYSAPAMQYETASDEAAENTVPIKKRSYKKVGLWVSSLAAVLLAIAVSVYLLNSRQTITDLSKNVIATKPGSKSKITLPDGTQVWLNADSKLTYGEGFGQHLREVVLTGEAFFDVVKDKARPFIIHAKAIDIKVVGTAFNVRSYPDEKTAETSLIRGIVEITLKNNPDQKIILKPNEKLVVQNEQVETSQKKEFTTLDGRPVLVLSNLKYAKGDSTAVETAWIKNKLAFDKESLEMVAKKIEKWYGVNVEILDNDLKNAAFTGVFEDETLSEVMDALKLTGNFKYSINKRDVTIRP